MLGNGVLCPCLPLGLVYRTLFCICSDVASDFSLPPCDTCAVFLEMGANLARRKRRYSIHSGVAACPSRSRRELARRHNAAAVIPAINHQLKTTKFPSSSPPTFEIPTYSPCTVGNPTRPATHIRNSAQPFPAPPKFPPAPCRTLEIALTRYTTVICFQE